MMKLMGTVAVLLLVLSAGPTSLAQPVGALQAFPAVAVPVFQVDPNWLQMPNDWVLGEVTAVAVGRQDTIWVLHRYRTVKPEFKPAPPVLQFDGSGKFIRAWGGPGEGYEWPTIEHGMEVDYKGNVWIGGEGRGDNHLLKFAPDGTLLLQVGRSGQSKGMADSTNFLGPTDIAVWRKTNEVFIGDTSRTGGGGRVMVLDADSGKFKRMWGAFGNTPVDIAPKQGGDVDDGVDPQQLREAHRVRVSNDGIVYVADGVNKRFQVFTVDGKFLKQVYVERGKKPATLIPQVTIQGTNFETQWAEGYKAVAQEQLIDHHETANGVALSSDVGQKYLYIHERSTSKIWIYDRKSLTKIGEFGDGPGRAPGQLYLVHDMRVDSKGNVFTVEVKFGARVQKFVLKGYMTPLTAR